MIYVSATNRQLTEKYVDWAVTGLPGAVKLNPQDIIKKTDCKKAVMFGVLRGTHLVYNWAKKNSIDFYYIDRPYWGETRNHPYYVKVVKNNHLKNWVEKRPYDRFEKSFPWPIKPWKKDGKNIIVCPPSNAMKEFLSPAQVKLIVAKWEAETGYKLDFSQISYKNNDPSQPKINVVPSSKVLICVPVSVSTITERPAPTLVLYVN